MNVALRGHGERVERAIEASGTALVPEEEADVVIVAGERAFRSLGSDPAPAPVLPVALDSPHAVAPGDLRHALETIGPDAESVSHPVLSLSIGADHVSDAALDAMLVTSEPARISEYAVRTADAFIDSFRADGVVVATPLGSSAYARAAGGPIVGSGAGLSVVPVSPFATRSNTWVLDLPVTLYVERDEGRISLVADGDEVGEVPPFTPVRIERDRTVELLRPAATQDRADWKNSKE